MLKKDKNKRNFDRVDMTQSTYFIPMGDFIKSDPLKCWINNVSLGGLSIDVNIKANLKIDDIIVVSYKLGDKERNDRVQIKRTLNVINNLRCGCEFSEEDKERSSLIDTYIKHIYMTFN